MSLVHESFINGAQAPAIHALIVGVADYPHLHGGASENVAFPAVMGQLTSPAVSARKFADWCISTLHNPDVPVGSVELLISEAQPANYTPPGKPGTTIALDRADFPNIKAATERWFKRCDTHARNIAVFYFCGHGIQKHATFLLPSDIGASTVSVMTEAINFDATYRGMARCAARTQFFFIDACRQTTSGILATDFMGQALISANAWEQAPRIAPKLLAANGLPAFGDKNGESRYTATLLEALNGAAADKRGGVWRVDSSLLGPAVQKLLKIDNEQRASEERLFVAVDGESVDTATLHVLKSTPKVISVIGCVPSEATDVAEFEIQRAGSCLYSRVPATPGLWQEKVDAGVYDVHARFVGAPYPTRVLKDEFFRPPVHVIDVHLEV